MTGRSTPSPTAATAPLLLRSVSAVMIADDENVPGRATLAAWGEALAELFTDTELVIIANGVSGPVALELEWLAADIPDLTIHFLAERIDRDAAQLVGLDTAIGDWILLAEPRPERLSVLRELIGSLREGYQVAVALGEEAGGHGPLYLGLASVYFRLYQALTKRTVLSLRPALRLYSRAAALYLAGSADGEMLLKTGTFASGFPAFIGRWPSLAPDHPPARAWRATVAKGLRELLTASSAPLRLASVMALAGGMLSLIYSLYVVGVYLFKPVVEAGWTTMSLQISGMMFLFSLLFALMAEYMLSIYRGLSPRRRYVITRELHSPRRRHSHRLNVINEEGNFHLGMPEQITLQ
jgi:polyisoprenyl-phosphate glycosyltransferase